MRQLAKRVWAVSLAVIIQSGLVFVPAWALGDSSAGANASVDEHGTVTVGASTTTTTTTAGSSGSAEAPPPPTVPPATTAGGGTPQQPAAPYVNPLCDAASASYDSEGCTGAAVASTFLPPATSAPAPGGGQAAAANPAAQAQARQAAVTRAVQSAQLRLQLPASAPNIGPDPSWNEWGVAAVGYPLWFWSSAGAVTATTTEQGIRITMVATPGPTTFAFGNGESKACATTTPYDRATVKPGTPSPTCGYTYLTKGSYTVTATTRWNVAWSAEGMSGTLNVDRSGGRTITVAELESVVTG